jgi:uncharacterized protein YoxC
LTGSVSWDALTWVVVIILTAGGVVAGFLLWIYGQAKAREGEVNDLFAKLEERWEKNLKDTALQIEAVAARCKMNDDQLARDISAYQMHVGETFATKAGVTQAVERVESAVDRFTEQMTQGFDRLTTRIDRLVENREAPTSAKRS